MEKVQWEASKRLLHGSLVCLSSDGFKSILPFVVADRKAEQLARGKISATFEGAAFPHLTTKQMFVMAETSAYFEAYRSVLLALQQISPANFPLKDYLLGLRTNVGVPDYLAGVEQVKKRSMFVLCGACNTYLSVSSTQPTYDLSTVLQATDEDSDGGSEGSSECNVSFFIAYN